MKSYPQFINNLWIKHCERFPNAHSPRFFKKVQDLLDLQDIFAYN